MRQPLPYLIAAIICVLHPNAAICAPLFDADETINAVLTAPLSQVYDQRSMESPPYLPGSWAYTGVDGAVVRLDLQVRTRGRFRRERCQYPPLQLNFRKSQVKNTLFAGQDKIKLVVPCQSKRSYLQYLALEYLAYRILQTLTPVSFDTRRFRISFNDADRKNRTWTHVTFVIEDEDAMARRNGMRIAEIPAADSIDLDPAATALVELYQFMIGNTDYSTIRGPEGTVCCHNIRLLVEKNGDSGLFPVPYDFDASGLVNAPYSAPADTAPIRNVRQRYFTGRCKPERYWWEAIQYISTKRDAIYNLFITNEDLSDLIRKRNLGYMRDFFKIIDDPKRVQKLIIDRCRGQIVHD